jgi:hypothetical protein
MRYFFDTEFIENGRTIDLISVGVVADDGRTFYAVNSECRFDLASEWVVKNVLVHVAQPRNGGRSRLCPPDPMPFRTLLPAKRLDFIQYAEWSKPSAIAEYLRMFTASDDQIEFWTYFGAYDWVALCQLFGTMMQLPTHWPMFAHDVKILADQWGIQVNDEGTPPRSRNTPEGDVRHHALADAHWTRDAFYYITKKIPDWQRPRGL